jgi:hypothetical protein
MRDVSAAEGFRCDAYADIRREAQRQTRPRRRSKLQVAARARTDACRLDGRPCGSWQGRTPFGGLKWELPEMPESCSVRDAFFLFGG